MAKRYLVTWDILIDAGSAAEAAADAARAIRSKDSPPLGFTVKEVDKHGTESIIAPREVDLSDYYWCDLCKKILSFRRSNEDDPVDAIDDPDGKLATCPICKKEVGELTDFI